MATFIFKSFQKWMAFLSLPNWEIILKGCYFPKGPFSPPWSEKHQTYAGVNEARENYFLGISSPQEILKWWSQVIRQQGHKQCCQPKDSAFYSCHQCLWSKTEWVWMEWVPALYLYLFIHLFIAALGLCCCSWVFPNCYTLVMVLWLLFAAASLVEHRFRSVRASVVVAHGLSSCGAWG